MMGFAIDVVVLGLASYLIGCAGGCWIRRHLAR